MCKEFRMSFLLLSIIFAFLLLPQLTIAQLISVKSVPVAEGDQFTIFPSQNTSMGGVSIALDDPLQDPFLNPAKIKETGGSWFYSAPGYYGISDENGSGKTLPVGGILKQKNWFAGVALAIQTLSTPQGSNIVAVSDNRSLDELSAGNQYFYVMYGRSLREKKLSFGISMFAANLSSLEGVELLYPQSWSVQQDGKIIDTRLGISGTLASGAEFEALILFNQFKMTHLVNYNFGWFIDSPAQIIPAYQEENRDQTNTWGFHLGYSRPIKNSRWRIGGILTTNYMTHPKIPNYELMSIPRDPGKSWAYNIGIGFGYKKETLTFGTDFIYEPIWSNTWAEVLSPTEDIYGKLLQVGDKTVDNKFVFSNSIFRIGIRQQEKSFGFQIGMQVRTIHYRLRQTNYIFISQRKQIESWTEWTPSLGFIIKLENFQIHYDGRFTTGTGQPGVRSNMFLSRDFAASNTNYIVAPSGPLTLNETVVFSHRVSIIIPIRE
jgi:hypothetical protein